MIDVRIGGLRNDEERNEEKMNSVDYEGWQEEIVKCLYIENTDRSTVAVTILQLFVYVKAGKKFMDTWLQKDYFS